MDCSVKIRQKIVTLREHTSKSLREIAQECGVHYSTVSRILKKNKEQGSFSPTRKGRCGAKPKMTAREKRMLISKSRVNPRATASELRLQLNLKTSNRTVRRVLFDGGQVARRPAKKQLLTVAMMKKRLQWAHLHRDWDVQKWQKVHF